MVSAKIHRARELGKRDRELGYGIGLNPFHPVNQRPLYAAWQLGWREGAAS